MDYEGMRNMTPGERYYRVSLQNGYRSASEEHPRRAEEQAKMLALMAQQFSVPPTAAQVAGVVADIKAHLFDAPEYDI